MIAVPNLAAAEESFRTLWGLGAVGGGRHEGAGTENLIVALDGSYLELVTVVDPAQASANPFGRLVSVALERQIVCAGWAVSVTAASVRGMVGQHLSRDGVAVDLYGVDGAVGGGDRPFGLIRPADQAFPGAGSESAARLVDLHVLRPGGTAPESITSADTVLGAAERTQLGRLASIAVQRSDGTRLTIDDSIRELVAP
ncbi:VOC family protein [Mycolicibacterium helvum]|uniref:VOC family protein n=1 Tax=Mycolicibacterium helvum TaxID=1534349 RepID=UPI0013D13179|nr:VOC family protein [Mycolicibacterium helvum]